MKKNGIRVVNWSLWRPAAALMRRLRFPGKMALISAAFLLPMAWLLAGFLSGERENLSLVADEREGVVFNQAAYRVLEATDRWSLAVQGLSIGGPAAAVDDAQQRFDQPFADLKQQHLALEERWHMASEWTQVERAVEDARRLQASDPKAATEALAALSLSVVDLMAGATDRSGLALDPELPTYYLMSAALMRGPEVIRRTSALRGLADAALRAGQIEGEQLALLANLRSQMRVELARARNDLDKVTKAQPELAARLKLSAPKATEEFLAQLDALFPVGVTAVQGDRAALLEKANRTLETQYAQVSGNLDVLDRMLAARETRLMRDLWITLGLTLASLLLAVFLAMGFYRAMFGGFKALRRHLMAISLGDLRSQIDGKGRDEISGLLREVGYMQLSLRQTVLQVQGASDSVVQASLEIATGTRDLSSRTEAAAAALEQSSAALEETSASVSHTAESARQASVIAGDNAQAAQRGGEVMQQVVHTMERIQASSRKINDIIGVIDGIAFQTNILALNAAVEAARAGDQGRGFAVVAGEVRSLAQRSAEAAKEIKALISSSVTEVDSGMHVVQDAGAAMGDIVHHADQVRRLLDEVADGTREQSLGMGQIGQAVQALDQNTQANAALVEETATAAASQRTAAVRMAAQVDEFRLPGESAAAALVDGVDVNAFIDAHRQWKVKLRDAIENQEKVDADKLSRDDCCALGQWIYGDGQRLGTRPGFVDLVDRHRRFHQIAGSVAEHINRRRYREAEDALAPGTPFSQATSDVVLVLASAKRVGF